MRSTNGEERWITLRDQTDNFQTHKGLSQRFIETTEAMMQKEDLIALQYRKQERNVNLYVLRRGEVKDIDALPLDGRMMASQNEK